jgi:hypothetical protein
MMYVTAVFCCIDDCDCYVEVGVNAIFMLMQSGESQTILTLTPKLTLSFCSFFILWTNGGCPKLFLVRGVEFGVSRKTRKKSQGVQVILNIFEHNNNNKEFTSYELSLVNRCHNHVHLLFVSRSYSIPHRRRSTIYKTWSRELCVKQTIISF